MTRRTSKHGTTYTEGSHSGWAPWQPVPVMCIICGKRVTLKDSWMAEYGKGTWHARCGQHYTFVCVNPEQAWIEDQRAEHAAADRDRRGS